MFATSCHPLLMTERSASVSDSRLASQSIVFGANLLPLLPLSLSLALPLWLHPSAFSLPIILICLPCRLLSAAAAAAAVCALTRTQEEGINQKRGKRKEGSKKVVSSRGTRVPSMRHRELALASRGRRQATREAKVVQVEGETRRSHSKYTHPPRPPTFLTTSKGNKCRRRLSITGRDSLRAFPLSPPPLAFG